MDSWEFPTWLWPTFVHTSEIFHDEKASLKNDQGRGLELALWLRALISLAETWVWLPAPTWWLRNICNSSSKVSQVSFWTQAPVYRLAFRRNIHVHKIMINSLNNNERVVRKTEIRWKGIVVGSREAAVSDVFASQAGDLASVPSTHAQRRQAWCIS